MATELLKQLKPFSGSAVAGITVDPATGTVTVVSGTPVIISQAFVMERLSQFSFTYQSTGTIASPVVVEACNDYDPNRPAQFPGSWRDVSTEFNGTTGASSTTFKPFSNMGAALAAGNSSYVVCWTFPFAAVRFRFNVASGTGTLAGAFVAKSI